MTHTEPESEIQTDIKELPTQFADFDLSSDIQEALAGIGYTSPTPIQARTIPLLLSGHDVIGCAQTGTGKTAAFALPVLERIPGGGDHPQALIITPTRELAEQIYRNILDYSRFKPTRSVVIYGGVPSRGQESQLKKGCDIVIATPGRLLDLLNQRAVRLYDVKFLILDEADRMLDMGFIPDIENIMTYVPRKRQTLLFSATMPPEIEKLARKITHPDAEMIVEGIRSSAAETVTQKLFMLDERDKFPLLIKLLRAGDMTSTIIFSRTKLGTANLAKQLIQQGVKAATIHSNLTQTQRQSSLDGFKRGDYKVLVATDIAARGLDISQVSHVINFDTPTHPEDYVHRIGRTGRAQSTGDAYTFCSPEEKRYLRAIEKLIGRSIPLSDTSDPDQAAAEAERGRPTRKERKAVHDAAHTPEPSRGRNRSGRHSRDGRAEGRQESRQDARQESPYARSESRQSESRHERGDRRERQAQPAPRGDRFERPRSERSADAQRHSEPSQAPGQAALAEVRKARPQIAYEPAPVKSERSAKGLKPTELMPRYSAATQSRQPEHLEDRKTYRRQQPAGQAPERRSSPVGGGAQHAAYHASRFMLDDDIDFLDDEG